eukprot:12407852-Karenia_brevis.AAC.1
MQTPAREDVRADKGRPEEAPLQHRLHADRPSVVWDGDLLRVHQPLPSRIIKVLAVAVVGHEAPLARHLWQAL